jgi:hypothetical protein
MDGPMPMSMSFPLNTDLGLREYTACVVGQADRIESTTCFYGCLMAPTSVRCNRPVPLLRSDSLGVKLRSPCKLSLRTRPESCSSQCDRKPHHRCCRRLERYDRFATPHSLFHRFASLTWVLLLLLCRRFPNGSWSDLLRVSRPRACVHHSHGSINTYIGASCMLIMLEAIWPSFKTYPNALPDSAGLQSNRMIAYFVFWTREFHDAK